MYSKPVNVLWAFYLQEPNVAKKKLSQHFVFHASRGGKPQEQWTFSSWCRYNMDTSFVRQFFVNMSDVSLFSTPSSVLEKQIFRLCFNVSSSMLSSVDDISRCRPSLSISQLGSLWNFSRGGSLSKFPLLSINFSEWILPCLKLLMLLQIIKQMSVTWARLLRSLPFSCFRWDTVDLHITLWQSSQFLKQSSVRKTDLLHKGTLKNSGSSCSIHSFLPSWCLFVLTYLSSMWFSDCIRAPTYFYYKTTSEIFRLAFYVISHVSFRVCETSVEERANLIATK